MLQRLSVQHTQLDTLEEGLSPDRRRATINELSQTIDGNEAAFQKAIADKLNGEKNRLQSLVDRLNSLSPLATLKRGYSISKTSEGEIITSSQQVNVGDRLDVILSEGGLVCTVDKQLD